MLAATYLSKAQWPAIEQLQARLNYPLHRLHCEGKNLIGHNLIDIFAQAFFQPASPRDSQFRVDMDDVDAGADRILQVFVVGSRSAMQGQWDPDRTLNSSNQTNLQVFLCCAYYHAPYQPVPIAHG